MDTEYRRWLDERKHQTDVARGFRTPPPDRPSIATAVGIPVLQSVAIGGALALLFGVLPALFGTSAIVALKLAVGGFTVGTAGTAVVFVVQERGIRLAPTNLAWRRLWLAEPQTEPPEPDDAEPWRVIRPYLAGRAPQMITAKATTMEQDVRDIEPDVRPEIRELYEFVCQNWNQNISRAECRKRGWTRRRWERYVGGKRGQTGESAKGFLARANVVEMDGGNGWAWRADVTLADVFSIVPELAEYADARAKMVQGRHRDAPDRTDGTGRDADGDMPGRSQTEKGRG